jgi:uncharacterized protein (TIGR02646 family)
MMYIAIDDLHIDAAWKSDAEAAALSVRNATPELRSKIISEKQEVWKRLKQKLRDLSHQKCWYCESIDPRSDNAVDHYRPKGNVKESAPPHKGYWWLAFDWRNFRFSCTFCNSIRTSATTSGGKHDYFPLWDEKARAQSDEDDIDDEQPLLLDPTNPLHIGLIAFADDGTPGPAFDAIRKLEHAMAKESIKYYHLDHPLLVERRAIRWREVRKWVEEADKLLERYVKEEEPYLLSTAKSRMQDIMAAISAKAVYSSSIKHLLAGMETKSDAAQRILKNR